MKKRIISLFLVLCMMLTVFPVGVFAAEGEVTPTTFGFTLTGEKNVQVYDSYYGRLHGSYNGWETDLIPTGTQGDLVTFNATAVGEDGETPIPLKVALLRIGRYNVGRVETMTVQEFVSGVAAFSIESTSLADVTYKAVIFADEGTKGTVSGSYTIERDAVVNYPSRVEATLPFETEYEFGSEPPMANLDCSVVYSVQYRVALSAGEEMTVTAMGKDSPIPVDLYFYSVDGQTTSGCIGVNGGNASDNMGVVGTFTAPTDGTYAVNVMGNIAAVGTVNVSITSRNTGAVNITDALTPDATVESIPSTFTFDKDSCKEVVEGYRAAVGKAFAVTLADKEALSVDFYGVDEAVDTSVWVYKKTDGYYYYRNYSSDNTYSDGKGESCSIMPGAGDYLIYLCAPINYAGSLKADFKHVATLEEIAAEAEKITLGETAVTRSFKYSKGIKINTGIEINPFDVFKADLTVGTTLYVNVIADPLTSCMINVYRVLEDGTLESCAKAVTYDSSELCGLKYSPTVSGTYFFTYSGYPYESSTTFTATVAVKDGAEPQDVMTAFGTAAEITLPYLANIEIPSTPYIVSTSPSGGTAAQSLRASSDTVEAYGAVRKLDMMSGDQVTISFKGATESIDTGVWIYGMPTPDTSELIEYFDNDNDGMGESATFTAPHSTTYYFFFGTTDATAVGKISSVAVASYSSLPENSAEKLLVSGAPSLVLPIDSTFTVSGREIIADGRTVYGVLGKLELAKGEVLSYSVEGTEDSVDTRIWVYEYNSTTGFYEYLVTIDNDDGTTEYANGYNYGETGTFTAVEAGKYGFVFGTVEESSLGDTVGVKLSSSIKTMTLAELFASDACTELSLPIDSTFVASSDNYTDQNYTFHGIANYKTLSEGDSISFTVKGPDACAIMFKYDPSVEAFEYYNSYTLPHSGALTDYVSGTFMADSAGVYGIFFGSMENGVGSTFAYAVASGTTVPTPSGSPAFGEAATVRTPLAELFASDACTELSLPIDSTFVAPNDTYVDQNVTFHGIARYKDLRAGDSISYNVMGPSACAIVFRYNAETDKFEYYDSDTQPSQGLLTDSVSGTFTVGSAGTYGFFFGSMDNGAGDTFAYAVASGTTVPTPSGSPAFGGSGSQTACGSDFKALFDDSGNIPVPFSGNVLLPMNPITESGITCVGIAGAVFLNAGQTVDIDFGGASASYPTLVAIYRSSLSGGNSVYYRESFNQSEGDQTVSFTATTAGTYMIFFGSTVPQSAGQGFDLSVSVSGGSSVDETPVMPDDLDKFSLDPGTLPFETTKVIRDGTDYTRSDDTMRGYVYKMAMTSGDSVDVTCTPVVESNGFDTKVIIYYKDSQGKFNYVGFYDNDAVGQYGEKVNYIADKTGTYYFFVGSYQNTAVAYSDTNCTIKIEAGFGASELFAGARELVVPSEFDYTLGSEDPISFAGVTIDGFVATVNVEAGKSVNVKFAGKYDYEYTDTVLELYRLVNGKYEFMAEVDQSDREEMTFYAGDEGGTFGIIFRSYLGNSTTACTVSLSFVEYPLISDNTETVSAVTLPSYNDLEKSDFENVILPTGMGVFGYIERFTLDNESSLAIRAYGKDINIYCDATLYRITEAGEWELVGTDDSFNRIGSGRHLWFTSLEAGDYAVVYEYLDEVDTDTVRTEIVSYSPNMTYIMDFTSATGDVSGDKFVWDNANLTLYLKDGFDLVTGNMSYYPSIILPAESTVMVSGNVEITSLNMYAIACEGALTVMTSPDDEYKATLTVKDAYIGIYAGGDMRFENINFNFSGYNTAVATMGSCSFIACNTDINTHHEVQGVFANDLLVNFGTFKVVAGSINISVGAGVSFVDAEVDLRSTNDGMGIMAVIGVDNPTDGCVTVEGSGNMFNAYFYDGSTAEVTSADFGFSSQYFTVAGDIPVAFATKVTSLAGDVNGDGKVNVRDVMIARQLLAGSLDASAVNMDAADVNNDGRINATDVRILRTMIAGIR